MVTVPAELVALASEKRLIPFVGAGFSDALELPSWESLLRRLTEEIEGSLSFDELSRATGDDFLQIAEYLFLKCDRRIGPIRHQVERALAARGPVTSSAPHVELANLGAPQIYTTNYDDLIEATYRDLGLPVTTVVLPKDVALANTERTQVVNYHGDLQHEQTLVLTESAYYKRLDFESPMDLKFRSDLLGKSVLFMGYSFRDINIRVIWFKLMDMMKDIPESDRRPSYVVRIEPNEALSDLYAAVGLQTIVLNQDGPLADREERASVLGQFLLDLSLGMQETGARTGGSTFVSTALLKTVNDKVKEAEDVGRFSFRFAGYFDHDRYIERLLASKVPKGLKTAVDRCKTALLPNLNVETSVELMKELPASAELTQVAVDILRGDLGARDGRRALLAQPEIWRKVMSQRVDLETGVQILGQFPRNSNIRLKPRPMKTLLA